jgi:hypothetical protein
MREPPTRIHHAYEFPLPLRESTIFELFEKLKSFSLKPVSPHDTPKNIPKAPIQPIATITTLMYNFPTNNLCPP